MKKRLITTFIFIFIFVFIWHSLSELLSRKDDKITWESFYSKEDNTIDILVMGSSLVMNSIDPYILSADTGLSTFDIAIAGQPSYVQKYVLEEVLKTQKPKLIIVETLRFIGDSSMDVDQALHSFSGMHNSSTKYRANLNTNLKEGKINRIELLFPLLALHNRWTDLQEKDFSPISIEQYERGSIPQATYVYSLDEIVGKQEEIFEYPDAMKKDVEDFINLATANGVEVLFLGTPNPEYTKDQMKQINGLYKCVEEAGGKYLDCNFDDYMLDWIDVKTDFYDYHHTNILGAFKTTKYLGNYINTNFSFTKSYSPECDEYIDYKNNKKSELQNDEFLESWLMRLASSEYYVYFKDNTNSLSFWTENSKNLFKNFDGKLKEITTEDERLFSNIPIPQAKFIVRDKETLELIDAVAVYYNNVVSHIK